MRRAASVFLPILIVLGASGAAQAQGGDRIGSAVVVVNMVTAQLSRDVRTLTVGDEVRRDELIEVGLDAKSELRLNDNTKLALGPGSRLKLDRFVYDPDQSGSSIVVNLVKGTFRFITGIAEKPAYVIRVPSASIAVRGTNFDVLVEESGRSWLLLNEGAVRICNDNGSCRIHDQVGKIISITDRGSIGRPARWASLPGMQDIAFDSAFPFIAHAPSVDESPAFTRDDIVGDGPRKPPRKADNRDKSPPKSTGGDKPKGSRHPTRTAGGSKVLDMVATYVPKLVERIRERDNHYDDGGVDSGLSSGGLLDHPHRGSRRGE